MKHICRICLKEATAPNFVALKTDESSSQIKMQLSVCVPEMVVDVVKDPVFCRFCVSTLHSAYNFKILCLNTEKLIKNRKILHSKSMNIEELLYDLQQGTKNDVSENTMRESFTVAPNMNLSLPDEISRNEQNLNTQSNTHQQSATLPIDALNQFKNDNAVSTSGIQITAVQLNGLLDNPLRITTIQPQVFKQECENENEGITIKEEDIAIQKVESPSYEGFEDTLFEIKSEDHTAEALSVDNKSAVLETNSVTQNCVVKITKLTDHIVHKRNRFICKICNFTTGTKYYLKKHEVIHDNTKRFSCGWCEFHTIQKDSLILHLRIHTGEKPFACNMCTYRAAQNSNLQTHLRLHTGEKPFACNMCNFRCAQEKNLKRHLQIHTGEKPFACNVCSYRCIQKTHLQKHLQIHTAENRPRNFRRYMKMHQDKSNKKTS